MFNMDCQHLHADEDSARCAICGWIFDCPDRCEEYINYVGKQPYKEDLEKKFKGE